MRRKSNGAQIPWESTSLEEDFWFIPPKELKKLSDAEREKAFKEELALWEKVQKSTDPGAYEDYLRRYPSGDYVELAQVQLDRLLARQGEKRVEIINTSANPYTKGSARTDTRYQVGDTYSFRVLDIYTKVVEGTPSGTIKEISDTEVIWTNGLVMDLLGNTVRTPNGARFSPSQLAPAEFSVGRHWSTRFVFTNPAGIPFRNQMDLRIVGRESVTVPAGTFNAFRVEGTGISVGDPGTSSLKRTWWYAPEQVRVPVAQENIRRARGKGFDAVQESQRRELVSFKQS